MAPLERKGRAPVARPFGAHWSSDFWLAMVSLAFGTPVIAGFSVAHDKWCLTAVYKDISVHPWNLPVGWAWAYWAVSIPVYMLIWDFWFYLLHLVLHMEPVYSWSHANHHAFKPPVAWSGIAIDPIEQLFSGIFPYTLPLLTPFFFNGKWTFIPFHIYTVYVINILLVAWALFLHSSSSWEGTWLFMGPVFHNMHHAAGIRNGNYGAIFKVYDRLFGTLLLTPNGEPVKAPWVQEEDEQRAREAVEAQPPAEKRKPAKAGRAVSKLKPKKA